MPLRNFFLCFSQSARRIFGISQYASSAKADLLALQQSG